MGTEKMKQHLDQAYLWLSRIPVTGEAVDHMAMARQELRAAFQLLSPPPENNTDKKEATDNG